MSTNRRTCTVDGCDRPHDARGFCCMHRRRWAKHGDPTLGAQERHTCKLDGCDRPAYGDGWCQMHYRRVKATGEPGQVASRYALTVAERLERDSDKSGDCWVWMGGRDANGYGTVGGHRTWDRVHRVAYRLYVGPIPDGMFVCHRCDNPPCWRPEHLFLGTVGDNNRDMHAKGRGRALPAAVVEEIYAMADGGAGPTSISLALGVPKGTISARLWKRRRAA